VYDRGYLNAGNLLVTGSFTALESGKHVIDGQILAGYDLAYYDASQLMIKSGVVTLTTAADVVVEEFIDTIRGDTFQDIPIQFTATLTAGTSYKLYYGAFFEQVNGVLNGSFRLSATVSRSK